MLPFGLLENLLVRRAFVPSVPADGTDLDVVRHLCACDDCREQRHADNQQARDQQCQSQNSPSKPSLNMDGQSSMIQTKKLRLVHIGIGSLPGIYGILLPVLMRPFTLPELGNAAFCQCRAVRL